MRSKIWIKKSRSFKEAERFDDAYYRAMSRTERLETVQLLREIYYKIKKDKYNAGTKRLRKVVKIIQQA